MSGHRRRILGVHREALRGADLDTACADNAAQPVDLPGLLLDLHADGLRRALALAGPAGDAAVRVDGHMSPGEGGLLRGLGRVHQGCRVGEQAFYHRFCHLEVGHALITSPRSRHRDRSRARLPARPPVRSP